MANQNYPIQNGSNIHLQTRAGSVPTMQSALNSWFQPMTFTQIFKDTQAFQVIEKSESTSFRGVIQPLTKRQLIMKPEGQRAWTWLQLHADPSLKLQVDDVVVYLNVQTRVMARVDYTLYGYVEYELVQDWQGPTPIETAQIYTGGDAYTMNFELELDGGDSFATGPDIDGGNAYAS